MKRNDAYWKERMEALAAALLQKGEEYAENLSLQYDKAIAEVEKQLSVFYERYAGEKGITLSEAKRLLDAGEIKEFRRVLEDALLDAGESGISEKWQQELSDISKRVRISRLDRLKIELRQEAEVLGGGQVRDMERLLSEIYREGQWRTVFEFQRGVGVFSSFGGVNERAVEKLLAKPWTADGKTFSDRIWDNQTALVGQVNTSLTQMFLRGEAPRQAIDEIAHRFSVSKHQASRLVMTESAAFSAAAFEDCCRELDVERYKIIAALDELTCPVCGALDGQIHDLGDYAVGVTAPPFHPNCRCCTAPYFADMEGIGERAARDAETGGHIDLPADTTYAAWKKMQEKLHGEGAAENGRS